MIVLSYTPPVTSKKGVIGFGDPEKHCDESRRTPQFLRLNYSSFQGFGGSDGRARALPVSPSVSRFANPFEPPPSFGDECSGFCKPKTLEATMANSVCTRTSAQNPTTSTTDTIDPVHLHMQAVNCLSRCKAMLLANEPMYTFALNNLAAAQKAIEALRALDMKMEG